MTLDEIVQQMDKAFRQEREEFFRVADSLAFQPKYKDLLEDIERIKQEWRDIPQMEDYPNFNYPPKIPEYFPRPRLFCSWKKNEYIFSILRRELGDTQKVIEYLNAQSQSKLVTELIEYADKAPALW